jgi:3-hydroxybutyryl-CoA dehydrogenase
VHRARALANPRADRYGAVMKAAELTTIAVVGAGQMGAGITQVAAANGLSVLLADADLERARAGKDGVARQLDRLVKKGKLGAEQQAALLDRITPVAALAECAPAEVAIEAASEKPELKAALFAELDRVLAPAALLLSNTSSISLTWLAARTSRPERVAGMHFMNPVPLMKLCEIVRGEQSSQETLDLVSDLAARLGKTVIQSRDRPGFIVNRMLIPLLNEACLALDERLGTLTDIDTGARLGLAHPLGPLELADLIGLDTVLAIAEVLHQGFGDDKYRPAPLLRNLVAAGWLGRKSGRGFYVYDAQGQRGEPAKPEWKSQ